MKEIEYIPGKGVIVDEQIIAWNTDRGAVRALFQWQHTENDSIIELAHFFDGDETQNIEQKRDLYSNYGGTKNSFFLSYDTNNRLKEIEIHEGVSIKIDDTTIVFDTNILDNVNSLKISHNACHEIEIGNFFFPALKMTIASHESMGGDGLGLGYFYCADDVSHLLEEVNQ